jgi:two-component system, LytTR family, sensor histidine kinase AlgZ
MRFFQEILVTSKAYRLIMLAMFIGHFIFTWSVTYSLFDSPQNMTEHLIVRAFIEALLLVGVCHCLVRPYLRLNMLAMSMNSQMLAKAFGYLIFVSAIYFLLSYFLGKTAALSATDISRINVHTHDGAVTSVFNLWLTAIFGLSGSFITLTTWSVLYLIYKYQMNKREQQKEMNIMQIQQLTSQLSPHFLFNTLNSIRALIFIDQERASNAITLLSDLLRSQMQTQLEAQTTFKHDWLTTKNYLNIEQIRFEDRMTIDTDFDDDVFNQPLPTLTLLTLTENAIKHGISPSSKPGFIKISAKKISTTQWQILVINSVYNDVKQHGTQIGLRNVLKRFTLLFGHNFTFSATLENQTYTVKMELPYVESFIG